MSKSPAPVRSRKQPRHWSDRVQESIVSSGPDGALNFTVKGGADNGQFVYISDLKHDRINYHSGKLHADEIILEVQGQQVSGFTHRDFLNWTNQVSRNGEPVMIKTVKIGALPKDLRQYLNTRFQKSSMDHDLQQTIRDNLYLRTVPCTTRKPRPGELNGVDYTFLNVDEFIALEKTGNLLENGIFDGNHYGTPKPPKEPQNSPFKRTGSAGPILSGQFLSSEGKRQRNLSNVELSSQQKDSTSDNEAPPTLRQRRKSIDQARMGEDGTELGSLPSNWEMAYTEDGTAYFIDHNTETTHWLDPRLKDKDPEEIKSELPYGWEKVEDPHYGTYYIDHVNRRTQYENPVFNAKRGDESDSDGTQNRVNGHGPGPATRAYISPPKFHRGDDRSNSSVEINGDLPPERPRPPFTRNPAELEGEFIRTNLIKSVRGFGFTIVGGDDGDEEFLQIKSIVPDGPAYLDRSLLTGDILVFVNKICVLGSTHQDVVAIFQTIQVGERVTLEVCRGFPLPFDPNDPNTEIVTTVAVTKPSRLPSANSSSYSIGYNNRLGDDVNDARNAKSMPDLTHSSSVHEPNGPSRNRSVDELQRNGSEDVLSVLPGSTKPELLTVPINRGPMGFGFTIADSAYGQKVKQILDRPRCKTLAEGDILVAINDVRVKDMPHGEVVMVLKECPKGQEAAIVVQRGGLLTPSKGRKKNTNSNSRIPGGALNSRGQDSAVPRSPFYSPDLINSSESTEVETKENSDKETDKGQGHSDGKVDEKGGDKGVNMNGPYSRDPDHGMAPEDQHYRPRTPNSRPRTPSGREYSDQSDPMRSRYEEQRYRRDDYMYHPRKDNPPPRDYPDLDTSREAHSIHGYDIPSERYGTEFRKDIDKWASSSFRYPTERPDPPVDSRMVRSRTPGPDMMRSGGSESFRDELLSGRSRTPNPQDMRSKGHSHDVGYLKASPLPQGISGTPAFIPASQYNKKNPYDRDTNRYQDNLYRNSSDNPHEQKSRPMSGPDFSTYRDNLNVNSKLNTSATYSDSLSFNSDRARDNIDGYGGRVPPEHPEIPPVKHPRKLSTSFEHEIPTPSDLTKIPRMDRRLNPLEEMDYDPKLSPGRLPYDEGRYVEMNIFLHRQESGFGFRIIGGTEEGSQVSVGHIVPGGAADMDGRIRSGDEITHVEGQSVLGSSHHRVVQTMGQAAITGRVSLGLRRPIPAESLMTGSMTEYPYDVTVTRRENEGFGFVIISSVTRAGSTIGRILESSPAERCQRLHIGDRILAVNHVDIMRLPHENIVNLIKESGYSVTLTVGAPYGNNNDDTSSTASTSQRSSQGSMINAMAYPAQGEGERRGDYSPHNYTKTTTVPSDYRYQLPLSDRYKDVQPDRYKDVQPDRYKDVQQQHSPNEPVPEDKYYAVELNRGSRGFGFSIRGGREFNNMPLYVLRVAEGGVADLDGRLKVGDQLLEINGQHTQDMSHAEAINIIQNGGTNVRLLVKRNGKLPPAMDRLTVRSPTSGGMTNGPISHSSPNIDPRDNPNYYFGGSSNSPKQYLGY